ncbi:FdtA/QdtA family cupin domain-containing protein [bacterium]|nr:FdtA/QdtA family cupin domain-containing protein [bacterium]
MKLQLKKFNKFTDVTGSLVPFYKKKSLSNFNIKRFFFIYGNQKFIRADHAHRKCNQVLIPVNGSAKITVFNQKKTKKTFIINDTNKKFLIIPKFSFIQIKFLKKNSILLTLCDYKYDKKEYIQKKEFFNI